MKLSDGEKLILIMLSEIHEKLDIRDGIDPKFVQSAIYNGCVWGLKWKYRGIFDIAETDDGIVHEVVNILSMWSAIERSYQNLSDGEKGMVREANHNFVPKFAGFDGNNEVDHIGVAYFLINELDTFSEFKGRDLNSHWPVLQRYKDMFRTFEAIRASLIASTESFSSDHLIELIKSGAVNAI